MLLIETIREHFLDHLIKHNLLFPQQHGFVPGKPCVSQFNSDIDH